MKNSITIDLEAIAVLALIILAVIAPFLLGWWIWTVLIPITFWEKLALMIALGCLILLIYMIEVIILAIMN